jgi:hypothetical protein
MVPFTLFRRLVMLGTPLILGLLEVGHPALTPGDNIFETLAPIATWWTALHVAQVPLFALMGLAAFLLVRDLDGSAARISRIAIAIFVVVYPAFDAAVGVASGVMMRNVGSLTADQRAALEQTLQALFWGPVTGLMAVVGSASWLVALVGASLAWRRAGAPVLVVGLLALSGLLLGVSHIRPFGPLACLAFLIAAAWIEFAWIRASSKQSARLAQDTENL